MDQVIALLEQLGWEADGETTAQTVRIPTARAPVYGSIGGELRTLGGRRRFHLPGSTWYVTVGKRSVYVYRRVDRAVVEGQTLPTWDRAAIERRLREVAPPYRGEPC